MKVTVYTIPNCPFCKQEKDYLTSKGVKFEEKDVQANKENLTEMLSVSDKFAGVPFTVIEKDGGEKVMLKGFTQSEFDAALGGGSDTAKPATPSTDGDMAKTADPVAGKPVAPAAPKPDAEKPVSPMGGATPPVSAPTVTDAMKSPMAGNMNTPAAPVNAAPKGGDMAMPTAPKPDAAMPVAPVGGSTPPAAAPKAEDAGDPQKELSGLLKDLESKTASPAAPANAAPTGGDTPKPAAPATGTMPAAGSATPPVAAPNVPDFNKQS